jgi:hypothetical protein
MTESAFAGDGGYAIIRGAKKHGEKGWTLWQQ